MRIWGILEGSWGRLGRVWGGLNQILWFAIQVLGVCLGFRTFSWFRGWGVGLRASETRRLG